MDVSVLDHGEPDGYLFDRIRDGIVRARPALGALFFLTLWLA